GFNSKDSAVFASAFADVHDYVIINGTLVPNMTREANAQVHQELFEGSRQSALGGSLSEIQAQYEIRNIRFLTPEITVVHVSTGADGHEGTIITAVMQKQAGEWRIVAFHNALVLKRP